MESDCGAGPRLIVHWKNAVRIRLSETGKTEQASFVSEGLRLQTPRLMKSVLGESNMPSQSERGQSKKTSTRMSEKPEPIQAAGQSRVKSGEDLKSREYTDKDGAIHHHTRRFMEQHKVG